MHQGWPHVARPHTGRRRCGARGETLTGHFRLLQLLQALLFLVLRLLRTARLQRLDGVHWHGAAVRRPWIRLVPRRLRLLPGRRQRGWKRLGRQTLGSRGSSVSHARQRWRSPSTRRGRLGDRRPLLGSSPLRWQGKPPKPVRPNDALAGRAGTEAAAPEILERPGSLVGGSAQEGADEFPLRIPVPPSAAHGKRQDPANESLASTPRKGLPRSPQRRILRHQRCDRGADSAR